MSAEGLSVLSNQYKEELEQSIEGLRKTFEGDLAAKAQEYQQRVAELQPTLLQMKDNAVDAMQDMSPFDVNTGNMTRTYAWTTLVLFAMGIAYGLARYLVGPLVGLFLSPFAAFMGAYVILPVAIFYYLWKPCEETPDEDKYRRHCILACAALQGLLTGTLYSHLSLSGWAPIAAVSAAVITAVLCNGLSFVGNDRTKLLGAALGGGMAAHLVLGLFVGFSMAYFLLALLYTAAGFVTIQLYIKNVTKDKVFAHTYQALFVCVVLFSDLLVMGLFAGDSRDVADANAAAASSADQ